MLLLFMHEYTRTHIWFYIKSNILYGAKHLFTIIKYSCSLNNFIINESVLSKIKDFFHIVKIFYLLCITKKMNISEI